MPEQHDGTFHQVHNTMSGTFHGPVVQAGSIGSFVYHAAPRSEIAWPLRVGRVPELASAHQHRQELRDALGENPAVLAHVLSGTGGVGKTQLAAAAARQAIRDGTDLVLWVDAARLDDVLARYAEAARLVDAPGASSPDVPTGVSTQAGANPRAVQADARSFLNWAATTTRSWLIVLDDVTDPAALRTWWPPTTGQTADRGRALVTTRRRDAALTGNGRTLVPVPAYTAAQSRAYLTQRLTSSHAGHLLDDTADQVAETLGHLPLALGFAAAWLLNSQQPCAHYLPLLRDRRRTLQDLLPADGDSDGYGRGVAPALLLSLEAAQRDRPTQLAAPALLLAAHLDPAGHPAHFWETEAVTLYLTRRSNASPAQPLEFPERRGMGGLVPVSWSGPEAGPGRLAVHLLHRYGLLNIDRNQEERAVRMHALTGRAARETVSAGEYEEVVRTVADALSELLPREDHHDPRRAAAVRASTDHLLHLTGDHLWRTRHHKLIHDVGRGHRERGLPEAALTYWRQQTDHARRCLGDDHPATLTARGELAALYQETGQVHKAVTLHESVLADTVRVHGARSPQALAARSQLASAYQDAGREAEALALQRHVVTDSARIHGKRDSRTLSERTQLAHFLHQAGDTDQAATLYESALAADDRVRIPTYEYPDVLATRGNLANCYAQSGRAREAARLQQCVVTDCERLLGAEHPHTLAARLNLATYRARDGRPEEAVLTQQHLVCVYETRYGTAHPTTFSARAALAGSYQAAGRTAEAIALREAVRDGWQRLLGADHPETLAARAALASSYEEAGRTSDATELSEQILADSERLLGTDHPRTLTARARLGSCYREAGRTTEAVALHESVVAAYERLRGSDAGQTLSARASLSLTYRRAGDARRAVTVQTQVVADSVRLLGTDHFDTLLARAHLALACTELGHTGHAITLWARALADSERLMGHDHRMTTGIRLHLAAAYHQAGRHHEATLLARRVLADRERLLGTQHPETVAALEVLRLVGPPWACPNSLPASTSPRSPDRAPW
ncbi:tetratricopeptide repeat protein [Streptomyces sp. AN091965]|uniref:tetratricopeptide repeat protein n=1 Tax=Streptomyces sp. AN091965 TaxID=2927803 RepID=UPI001F60AACE|nr:tetratricopeptide repeat protein [Streptomyces sp. AN091965]MCI3928138.1 tetratricopeptide repeat protein [Streptomyces sp. AN091965]